MSSAKKRERCGQTQSARNFSTRNNFNAITAFGLPRVIFSCVVSNTENSSPVIPPLHLTHFLPLSREPAWLVELTRFKGLLLGLVCANTGTLSAARIAAGIVRNDDQGHHKVVGTP